VLDTKRHPIRAGMLLGLIHGVLFGMAFPPFGFWFLALVAPIPLIFGGVRADRAFRAALGAGLGTAPMWAFHHQYTWQMTEAAFVPLALYLAIYPGLFVWVLARTHRRWPRLPLWVAAPIIWTGLEVLRGEVVWDGYAQYLIAHPLIDRAIAIASQILGVYGATFAAVVIPASVTDVAMRVHRTERNGIALSVSGALCAVVFLLLAVGSSNTFLPYESDSRPTYRIAAIQTNVPQDNRASQSVEDRLQNFRDLVDLSREAAEHSPKPVLIVWPETMFPGFALNASAVATERAAGLAYPGNIPTTLFYDSLIELQKEIGIPILVGATSLEGLKIDTAPDGTVSITQDAIYNSAVMVRDGSVEEQRYDKMQLMPFGEVMPYISNWDWLERQLLALGGRGLTFDLEAGKSPTTFPVTRAPSEVELKANRTPDPLRIATPICFESVFARQMRRLVNDGGRRRADLFINMSNDGWFAWYDAGRENLLLQCRWRCLELGTPMLRSVNTGISAAIDADGRVISTLAPRTAGVVVAEFDVRPRGMTIYARTGDVLGWASLAGMLLLTAGTFWKKKNAEAAAPAASKEPSA
jgi:apolipoprotein N-acyltransferase